MHCCLFAHRMRFQLLSLPFQLYDYFFNNSLYFWLHWISVAVQGLSLAVLSGGSSLAVVLRPRCCGLLQSSGSELRAQ